MIYLIDPQSITSDRRCILNQPLYGIPPDPCRSYCGTYCSLKW